MEFCSGVKHVQRPSLKKQNKENILFETVSEMHDHNSNTPPLPLLCNIALWLAGFTARLLTIDVSNASPSFFCFLEPGCN